MILRINQPLFLSLVLLATCFFLVTCATGTSSNLFSIGGNLNGLNGTVVLQNNADDTLTLTDDGDFIFATNVPDGFAYTVTILTQPTGYTCVVSNGTGIVEGENISSIAIKCSPTYTVFAWGDSLTAGSLSGSYPKQLALLLDKSVYNGGIPGQTSTEIAAREGGVVPSLTLSLNQIPKSGAVSVSELSISLLRYEDKVVRILGSINGVTGNLTKAADDTYSFTRTSAGQAITNVDANIPFLISSADQRQSAINIFWLGRNNFGDTLQVKADIAAAVAFLNPQNNKFIILSILNGDYPSERADGGDYDKIIELNNDLQLLYPDNYIDIRSYLINQYNPEDAQDIIDFNNNVVPSSLRSDNLHLNTTGYDLVALEVFNFIEEHGWQ